MKNNITAYLDQLIARFQEDARRLQQEGHTDQANFMKISANVYGIFRSVYEAMKGDKAVAMQRFAGITGAWEANLARARQHGDDLAAYIEQLKLDTAHTLLSHVREMEAEA